MKNKQLLLGKFSSHKQRSTTVIGSDIETKNRVFIYFLFNYDGQTRDSEFMYKKRMYLNYKIETYKTMDVKFQYIVIIELFIK